MVIQGLVIKIEIVQKLITKSKQLCNYKRNDPSHKVLFAFIRHKDLKQGNLIKRNKVKNFNQFYKK